MWKGWQVVITLKISIVFEIEIINRGHLGIKIIREGTCLLSIAFPIDVGYMLSSGSCISLGKPYLECCKTVRKFEGRSLVGHPWLYSKLNKSGDWGRREGALVGLEIESCLREIELGTSQKRLTIAHGCNRPLIKLDLRLTLQVRYVELLERYW